MDKLIIVGASGHGRVVADIAKLNGYKSIVFLDRNSNLKECAGYDVLGSDDIVNSVYGDVFIAIGNAETRQKLMEKYCDRHFPVLAHPSAVIAEDVIIGDGTVVMAGTVINPNVTVGRGAIINTSSSIDHDCRIGDYVHISVGAHVAGTVCVDNNTWIGAGATISNNVHICNGCTIGAGALVIKDIEEPGIYIGVPTRKMNQ